MCDQRTRVSRALAYPWHHLLIHGQPGTAAGSLRVRGRDVSTLDDAALTELRGETLGFISQFHHLLPGLSVIENVMLPAASREGRLHDRQRPRAAHLLEQVGLIGQEDRLARQLSGGPLSSS